MPISITLYNVFIASPNDVKEERESLQQIVNEINQTSAKNLNIKLELIRWETHSYPSFGNDAQDVINKQLNDDYDIFIGIMWSRFGTPTNRDESGTKEEFIRAYERWKSSNGKEISIMFYFKEAPIMFDKIDVEQIQSIREFKNELSSKGGLYWTYKEAEEFRQIVRIHINNALVDLVRNNKQDVNIETDINNRAIAVISDNEVEELGLLEIVEISYEKMMECAESIENITRHLKEYTEKTNQRTKTLKRLGGTSESIRLRETNRIIDKAAGDLVTFAEKVKIELPILETTFNDSIQGLSSAFSVWKSQYSINKNELENIRNAMSKLQINMDLALKNINNFRNEISIVPNTTSAYNKAKRAATIVLDDLINELNFSSRLISDFEKMN